MAPSIGRHLELLVSSERTPESVDQGNKSPFGALAAVLGEAAGKLRKLVKGAWGHEIFSPNETSAENEMSVVQYANLCGKRILLTADAGRSALTEAADFVPSVGLQLPGIDHFQVPHHGSRRNVSTKVLDRWLGPRLVAQGGSAKFHAFNSSAKADEAHPRKAVKRAIIHRGGNFYVTEGQSIRTSMNARRRDGRGAATPASYPEEQEED